MKVVAIFRDVVKVLRGVRRFYEEIARGCTRRRETKKEVIKRRQSA